MVPTAENVTKFALFLEAARGCLHRNAELAVLAFGHDHNRAVYGLNYDADVSFIRNNLHDGDL